MKNVFIYTNPATYIIGVGFLTGGFIYNITHNTGFKKLRNYIEN